MPQKFDIEGVGTLEFPDDAGPQEIQKFLDENYNQGPHPSALRAAGGHAAANILPGAAFVAGAVPGAKLGAIAGAAIPVLGETGIGEIGGGIIGGMISGTLASMAASKAQSAAAKAVVPEFAKKAEEELAAGEKYHPWASAAGDVAAMAASARVSVPTLKQLPFRAALGLGLGAALPVVTQQRLPTGPEVATGVASGLLFGEGRFTKGAVRNPPATPEVRAARKQELLAKSADTGNEWTTVPGKIPGNETEVAVTTKDGKVIVSEEMLNEHLEQNLPKGVSPERAIQDLIDHETVHGQTRTMEEGDKIAKSFWDSLTGYEKMLERRRYHGPGGVKERLSDVEYGHEALRFWLQKASGDPSEFISSTTQEIHTSKFLTAFERAVRAIREKVSPGLSETQNDILDRARTNIEALKKGDINALEPETTQPVRDVLPQPGESQGPVSPPKGSETVGEGGGKAGVAEEAPVPLKHKPFFLTASPEELNAKAATLSDGALKATIANSTKALADPNVSAESKEALSRWRDVLAKTLFERQKAAPVPEGLPPDVKAVREAVGPDRPLKGEIILEAAYIHDDGRIYYGSHHPMAVARLGDKALSNRYEERESRNTPQFGYRTNKRPFVPRELGGTIAEKAGQKIENWETPGKPHSDEILSATEPGKTVAEQTAPAAPTVGPQPAQAQTGLATAPPAALTAGGPAAIPSISPPVAEVKPPELQSLEQRLADPNHIPQPGELLAYSKGRDEWLARKSEAAKAGKGKPLGMTMKKRDPTELMNYSPEDLELYLKLKAGTKPTTVEQIASPEFQKNWREFEALRNKYNGNPPLQLFGKLGMTMKAKPGEEEPPKVPPQELVKRIEAITPLEGIGDDISSENRPIFIKTAADHIVNQFHPDQWDQALDQLQARINESIDLKVVRDERRQELIDMGVPPEEVDKVMALEGGARQTMKLSQADINFAQLKELQSPVTPKPVERKEGTEGPVRPQYNYPKWKNWWTAAHQIDPSLPEPVARSRWAENVYIHLQNATVDRLRNLIRAARLEWKYRGMIMQPDVDPIVSSMKNAPENTQSREFKQFVAGRGLSVEQGMKIVKVLKDRQDRETKALKAMIETEGVPWQKMTPEQFEGLLERMEARQKALQEGKAVEGELVTFKPSQRGAMGPQEAALFEERWREAVSNAKRKRQNIINDLAEWMISPSRPPVQDRMRGTVTPNDLWHDTNKRTQAYVEFSPQESQDILYIKDLLNQGVEVKGHTVSTHTRGLALWVDPISGQLNLVSHYTDPNTKVIRFYDPTGVAGSKIKKHLSLAEMMSRYRLKAAMLVRDPVYRFHQRWTKRGDMSAEQVYEQEFGKDAKAGESNAQRAYDAYLEKREERFRGGSEATAETEKERAQALTEWQKAAQEKEAEGARAWEEGSEPPATQVLRGEGGSVTGEYAQEARANMGVLRSDLGYSNRGPMTSREAEAITDLFNQYDPKTPEDMLNVLKRVSQMRLHIDFATGKMWGLRGRDYCIATALDKAARHWYLELYWDPPTGTDTAELVRLIKELPRAPKRTDPSLMTPEQQRRFALENLLQDEAIGLAVRHIYEIAQNSRTKNIPAAELRKLKAEEKRLPFHAPTLREEALALYGENSRRDIERAALSEKRSREHQLAASGERTLLAGSKFGGAPRARGAILAHTPEKLARPVEEGMLPPGAAKYVPEYSKGALPILPTGKKAVGGKRFKGVPPEPKKIEEFEFEKGAPMLRGEERPRTVSIEGRPIEEGRERGFVPARPGRWQREPTWSQSRMQKAEDLLREVRKAQGDPHKLAILEKKANNANFTVTGNPDYLDVEAFLKARHPAFDRLGFTLKSHGVARRWREEMAGQGRATEPEGPDRSISNTELIAMGKKNWKGPGDAHEEMLAAEQGKRIGVEGMAKARYMGALLQRDADQLREKLGKDHPDARDAQKYSDNWQARFESAFGTTAGELLRLMQGYQHDLGIPTFVKRMAAKAKKAPLTPEEEKKAEDLSKKVTEAEDDVAITDFFWAGEVTDSITPKLDKGNQKLVDNATKESQKGFNQAKDFLKGLFGDKPGMAAKGAGDIGPTTDPEVRSALAKAGAHVMMELSKAGELDEWNWKARMVKEFGEKINPHLDQAYSDSIKMRDDFLNTFIGTGSATMGAKVVLARKRPTVTQSFEAIQRAVGADPQGKKITKVEAYNMWNYVKQRFLDRGIIDFKEIRLLGSQELGISPERIYRAVGSNRTLRPLNENALRKLRNEARVKNEAVNWIKNLQYPGWLRFIRRIPRYFFMDKIFGHGTVGEITHASNMLFNPYAWNTYFHSWRDMYAMTFGTKLFGTRPGGLSGEEFHQLKMEEIRGHDRFAFWTKAGLQIDPFKYTDDYQIQQVHDFFKGWVGGRGFDALKTLRLARAEQWLNSLPEHLRTKEMAELISDSVNHATGIVKSRFWEGANWLLFAPKLEASRWAFLFKDTIKAGNYLAHWKTSTPEQRSWAMADLRQKAVMLGMYYSTLAMCQGFLKISGSQQNVNFDDPSKADFMALKVPGFKIGVINPLIGIVKLFGGLMHAGMGERTQFEKLTTRQREMGERLWSYGRGKFSPALSFGVDAFSGQDYTGRPLPWSGDELSMSRRLQGIEPYTTAEYLTETFLPIPLEEAVREMWKEMGMGETMADRYLKSIAIAGAMAATGARVTEDTGQ